MKLSAWFPGNYSDSTHKNVEVAVKITTDHSRYDREIRVYEALNATKDLDIEKMGIPRIFYNGALLIKYRFIAMTLFDGTLDDLYMEKGNISPDLTILMIFKQTVCVMRFI